MQIMGGGSWMEKTSVRGVPLQARTKSSYFIVSDFVYVKVLAFLIVKGRRHASANFLCTKKAQYL